MFADPICYFLNADWFADGVLDWFLRAENPRLHLNAAQQSDAQVKELQHE